MPATALLYVPSAPLQQKVQKNYRLTTVGVGLLIRISIMWGCSESAAVERLIREQADRMRIGERPS